MSIYFHPEVRGGTISSSQGALSRVLRRHHPKVGEGTISRVRGTIPRSPAAPSRGLGAPSRGLRGHRSKFPVALFRNPRSEGALSPGLRGHHLEVSGAPSQGLRGTIPRSQGPFDPRRPGGGGAFLRPPRFFANISKTATRSAAVLDTYTRSDIFFAHAMKISDPGHSRSGHHVTSSDLTSEKS